MEKLLKPARLAIDPNSSSAAKEWRHWVKTFQSYISLFPDASSQVKLAALVNCATPEVYENFDHCENYEEAEATLGKLFIKQPNEIFARHVLRTEKQKPNQTLADFRSTLTKLAKNCNFKDVTAAQYKDDMLRDAFINGIMSAGIRQRLLEHKTLTMSEAYEQAVTLDDAKRDNLMFKSVSELEGSSVNSVLNVDKSINEEETALVVNKPRGSCLSCGSDRPHDYKRCKAKSLSCFNCGQKGHLSRVCRVKKKVFSSSARKNSSRDNSAAVDSTDYSVCLVEATAGQVSDSFSYTSVTSQIGKGYYCSQMGCRGQRAGLSCNATRQGPNPLPG